MGLKFDLDPTPPKAAMIAILLFCEALLLPLQLYLLQTGELPSTVVIVTMLVTAFIQLVTYLLGFLGVEKEETKQ